MTIMHFTVTNPETGLSPIMGGTVDFGDIETRIEFDAEVAKLQANGYLVEMWRDVTPRRKRGR